MDPKQFIKDILKGLPIAILARNIIRNMTGHYYSPLPSFKDIKQRRKELFKKEIPLDIDMNYNSQLEKLKHFSELSEDIPFYHEKKRIRFNIDNESFSYDDGPILHYMMRLLKPSKIIEIGSGHSSSCMLDTNNLYLDGKVEFTFIDICLKTLKGTLRSDDYNKVTLIEKGIQDVNLQIFEKLEENDILFIDSSHVSKIGSDLNTIMFDIIPRIKSGVHIHFHDIRYPFNYLEEDIDQRIYFNEAYVLRAFLQYNKSFKISFWLNYLLNSDNPEIEKLTSFLPLNKWAEKFGHNKTPRKNAMDKYSDAGGSIWLTKVQP